MDDESLNGDFGNLEYLQTVVIKRLDTLENEIKQLKEGRANFAANLADVAVAQSREHGNYHNVGNAVRELSDKLHSLAHTVAEMRDELDSVTDSQERDEQITEWLRDNNPELNAYVETLAAERAEALRRHAQDQMNNMFNNIAESGFDIRMLGPDGQQMSVKDFLAQKMADRGMTDNITDAAENVAETFAESVYNKPQPYADETPGPTGDGAAEPRHLLRDEHTTE